MKIAIGADHRGYNHKEFIKHNLSFNKTIEWIDVGAYTAERSDYPVFAQKVVYLIKNGTAECGILICGSGIGMAIAANRVPGIYAGLVWNEQVALISKEHDNTNIIVLPSDFVSPDQSLQMIHAWLNATFKEERYRARINLIDNYCFDRAKSSC